MALIKGNVLRKESGLKFTLENKVVDESRGIEAGYVAWGEELHEDANDMLAASREAKDGSIDKKGEIFKALVQTALADGPKRSKEDIYPIPLRKHRVLQLPERGEVIVTEAELKKHLDTAEESPNQIAAAVLGLPEKTLRYKPSPDKWCIWEMLGHMTAMEILYASGIRQMLADKHLVIAPIDQDDCAKNLGILESSPPVLVALYGLNRYANVRLLRRLKAEDLQKSIRHPELDHRVTVADYVKMLSMHGPNHLEQIERLKKEATGEQN
jgi:hypothetical protein